MLKHIRVNLLLLGLSVLICSVVYPLSVLVVGQGLGVSSASGSIVSGPDGKPVGSRFIAQEFIADQWFHPRPSAVGYTANASGGSNWGANNPKLRQRVEERLKLLPAGSALVPADAVTASGSGLDPHITLANAELQQRRVAEAWAAKTGRQLSDINQVVDQLLKESAFRPLLGLTDDGLIVNVLELNLELSRRLAS